jgi:CBS domain-containing protein
MKTPVETIGRDEGVFSATQFMRENQVHRLPAVDEDGRLIGMVTLDDLLRVLSLELSNLIEGIKLEMAVGPMGETSPVI